MDKALGFLLAILAIGIPQAAAAQESRPWMDREKSPDERANLAIAAMSLEEQLHLLHGSIAITIPTPGMPTPRLPSDAIPGAGYVPGVPRLGIPALYETDASLGIANPLDARPGDVATALPAGLALSSSFDPALAYRAGSMVGAEARAKGFNVLLGGGMNLTRDPRNGRNFEYLGEDPWLAGVMAGEEVRGTQDQHVISTLKHFALNANETNRYTLDARVDEPSLRESDLLAFNIAIEHGQPGAIMCAYNKVNGVYACGNDWLLNQVLKHDWGFRGWVMSDWGAVHATDYARKGLDQQSGEQADRAIWFGDPLKAAVEQRLVPVGRIHDMAHRILRSMFAVGIVDTPPVKADIDYKRDGAIALEIARKGIVLLKNDGELLPIGNRVRRIAVIGGNANFGVLSGGGSAQVIPSNGPTIRIPLGGHRVMDSFHSMVFDSPAPLVAIEMAAPQANVSYDAGAFPAAAAALAARSDLAIVFVTRHELEGSDIPNLELPYGQDALIESVVAANPHTIVVLETGNPVAMPWAWEVPAIVEAWYPGQEGGQAIADILFGTVNPSGRLPITFPRQESDCVRPRLANFGAPGGSDVSVNYSEGADVGYRWYHLHGITPLFAFGHGLSYTQFDYDQVKVTGGKTLTVQFDIRNSGTRAGSDVPQLYLVSAAGKTVFRMLGFQRVELNAGEHRLVTMVADRRLLGSYDAKRRQWRVHDGFYQIRLGKSAGDLVNGGEARVTAQLNSFGPSR
jgi:beta-glucosidase